MSGVYIDEVLRVLALGLDLGPPFQVGSSSHMKPYIASSRSLLSGTSPGSDKP